MSDKGMMIQVPRWRMVVETGYGWDELNDYERAKAREYLTTDQMPELVKLYGDCLAKIARQANEHIEDAVMKALTTEVRT